LTRVENYRSLKPGDIVRPAFGAGKGAFGVMMVNNTKEPFQHFLVLSVDVVSCFSKDPPDGCVTVLTDDGLGYFSGLAVLFVD